MKLNEYLDELEEYRLSCYGKFIKGNDRFRHADAVSYLLLCQSALPAELF